MPTKPFEPQCLQCHYDLSGIPDGACPECGVAFRYVDLRAAWMARVAPESDEALLAKFVATCPGCRYDLRGLPDGVCPECGLGFTLNGLQAAWIAAHRRKALSPAVTSGVLSTLASGLWLGSMGALFTAHGDWIFAVVFGAAAVALSAWWANCLREFVFVRAPVLLFAAWPVITVLCLAFWENLYSLGPLIATPWTLGVLMAWFRTPGRRRGVPALLAGLCLLSVGTVGTLGGAWGLLEHRHWSHVLELAPPPAARGHQVRMVDEFLVGLAYLAAGTVCLALARSAWRAAPPEIASTV